MSFFHRILRKAICSGVVRHRFIFPVADQRTKTIYLTFDDGPHPQHTSRLLDLLKLHSVKGTFFVNGNKLDLYPDVGNRLVRDGHLMGNHTYSHRVFSQMPSRECIKEIERGQAVIERFQSDVKLFRPPQGLLHLGDLLWLVRNGTTLVMWSLDSHDSFHLPAQQIIDRVTRLVHGDCVLLFHDDAPLCIEVLETMIPYWRSKDFSFKLIKPGI